MSSDKATSAPKGGLEDVVAGTSAISSVDGYTGKLAYRGIDFQDLAEHSTFEETAYLLWHGQLPTAAALSVLENRLSCCRDLPDDVAKMITSFPQTSEPMMVLRTVVSALEMYDPGGAEHHHDIDLGRAILLTSRVPTIIAYHHRARQKLDLVEPRHDLSLAANFLYMLSGKVPSKRAARVMDQCLVIHADHELNASTFAARVAAATLSDLYSSATAAVGTLSGPLHGRANERVMEMLERIGEVSRVEEYLQTLLEHGGKVPGFGHRVYRLRDPRAKELSEFSEELGREAGDLKWYDMTRAVEQYLFREKGIYANVDLYSASVYHLLGIATDLFTPVFAISRMVGWTAHILEQYRNNRLIRPRAEYIGLHNVPYVPIKERSSSDTSARVPDCVGATDGAVS
jgi:citrate synthase